jgi:hypothetical protein
VKRIPLGVVIVGGALVCLSPMLLTDEWRTPTTPQVTHQEPEHIKGEVVVKQPKSLDPDSCWQLGLRTLSSSQIQWVCVVQEDWDKHLLQSTYSR